MTRASRAVVANVAMFWSLCACSSSGAGAPNSYPATHRNLPRAVSAGGPVVVAPQVIALSFDNDPLIAAIDTFFSQLQTAPEYWQTATAEYGVHAIASMVNIHLSEIAASQLTDAQVRSWLADKIESDSSFPQPDNTTVYEIFYPAGTTVVVSGETTCSGLMAYHDSFVLGPGRNVAYAVIPRCVPSAILGTLENQLTSAASHELVEMVTNPFPHQAPAYASVDIQGQAWAMIAGGELADLCSAFATAAYVPTGFDHAMAHTWSNTSASLGDDPCDPSGPSPYFNSAPVLQDPVTVRVAGKQVQTQGVKLASGQSATIELDLYSAGPTGPFKVSAVDLTSAALGGAPLLSFTLDNDVGQNGDKLHLTIKAIEVVDAAPFLIENVLGDQRTFWVGVVSPI